MIIGIDFDNTVVCYDNVFYEVALEKGLIPETVGRTKNEVKEFLINSNRRNQWIELQGIVYGPEIIRAKPFPGVLDFLQWCKENKIKTRIISHKTKYPFIGEQYDLHLFAKQWLQKKGFFENKITGMSLDDAFFNTTKEEKVKKVEELGCNYFIDDLPEIFELDAFPKNTASILFDPQSKPEEQNFKTVKSWEEFKNLIKLNREIISLINAPIKKIRQIKEGKNNQGFEVIKEDGTEKGAKVFLKKYFHRPDSQRDRLLSEFSFISFAWNKGILSVPRPLKQDEERKMGLFEFVEGRKLNPGEITKSHLQQALDFFKEINLHKNSPEARALLIASEACFSIQEHLDCVEDRINKLKQIEQNSAVDGEAIRFVAEVLEPAWKMIVQKITEITQKNDLNLLKQIAIEERCISPSDFGFHNALINNESGKNNENNGNKITFIDFEYAGWDDPAKMACDFFCQPEAPVSLDYFEDFITNIFAEDQEGILRTKMLLPLHKIKWCCIMLNEFMPANELRRTFALGSENKDARKEKQLDKVKEYFEKSSEILKTPEIQTNRKTQTGRETQIISSLHQGTARDYLSRMNDHKVECMKAARQYEKDYWDGDRRFGYGGYRYMPGRLEPVAKKLIEQYNLSENAKILDVGCGKGYLLYELKKLLPNCTIVGFDISKHALQDSKEEIKTYLRIQRAEDPYPFQDKEFDLIISITTLHNLYINNLKSALTEIERTGKNKYIAVESYRNEEELFNLQCWALTAEAFFTPQEWVWLFKEFGYNGDYEFIYF